MEFRFSDEEEDLRKAVSDFAQREIAEKNINVLDHIPIETIQKMGELGFFSLKLPEAYNGQSGGWVDIGILIEELAIESIGLAHLAMVAYEAALLLATFGENETLKEWMPDVVQGNKLGSVALTESSSGCDHEVISTTAIKDGESYIIIGEKGPVSLGFRADYTILTAKTDSKAGNNEITAFLVPLNLQGITKSAINSMGLSSSALASFTFDNVVIPAKFRLGSEGEGLEIVKKFGHLSELGQLLSALICVGAASSAIRMAVRYSRDRFAFGRPIGQFEAVSGKIAEDVTWVEAARWLCYRGLWLKDQGFPNKKEAAMCGWLCPNMAFQIIENTLIVHGHLGYTDEFPIQQMLRDVIGFEMIAGTAEMLKLKIAKETIGDMAIPIEMR